MSPRRVFSRARRPKQSLGLGLVGAIFVIIVVSLLSVAMSRMIEIDQTNYSYEILALKAFMAAESGAQLGANRLFIPGGGGSCVDRSFAFSDPSLANCTASVSCSSIRVRSVDYYTLTSSSRCLAGSFVTRRTIQVRMKD